MNHQPSLFSISFKGTTNQTLFSDVDTRSSFSLRMGLAAGALSTGSSNVFVGTYAGRLSSPEGTIALGTYAGERTSGTRLVLIGTEAGRYASTIDSVVIGTAAGMRLTGADSVLLGPWAGGLAELAGGQHVVVGARAAEFATGDGTGDTVIGYGAGRFATGTQGSNVVVGKQAGERAHDVGGSVLVGHGAGANAFNLTNSVVIGIGAGPFTGGDQNVILGGGAAPAVLMTGSCNVVIGGACDTVAAATQSSVSVGLACASADGSVSIGTNVKTSRYNSTSIGNGIVSMSDYTVSLGGSLTVNAVNVFSDPLNVYVTPDAASSGMAHIVYDATRSTESITLSPGYENIEDVNTTRRYHNDILAVVDSTLLRDGPTGWPYLLELGTTAPVDDDAQLVGHMMVTSAKGDIRASAWQQGGHAHSFGPGLSWATTSETGIAQAMLVDAMVTSTVSATFDSAIGMDGHAYSNLTQRADAFVRWTAYVPKRLRKLIMPVQSLSFGPMLPFTATQSLSCNLWKPSYSLNDVGPNGGRGVTTGCSSNVWVMRAPTYGTLGTIGVLASSPQYTRYTYCLPSTLTDAFVVRAATFPPTSCGYFPVPADADVTVNLTYSPLTFGFGSAVPLITGGGVTWGGHGCPVFYGTVEGALNVTGALVVGSNVVGDWGRGMCGLSPPLTAQGGDQLTLTLSFGSALPATAVNANVYAPESSDAYLYPDGPLTLAFYHDGLTSSNVTDPKILAFASLADSAARMLVVKPPQTGFLTSNVPLGALMEVPLNQLSQLRYVAIGGGSNDTMTVRFARDVGNCSASSNVVLIKHYVYTRPGVYAPTTLTTSAAQPQFSAGYWSDDQPPSVLPPSTSNLSGWYSRAVLPTNAPSSVRFDVDLADRVSLFSSAFRTAFTFDASQAASTRMVILTNPTRGLIALCDAVSNVFTPVRYVDWGDLSRAYYQHDGSPATVDPDQVTVCWASHDFDADTSRRFTLEFYAKAHPALTANAREAVYGNPSVAAPVAHTLGATFLATDEPAAAQFHMTSSIGLSNLPSNFAQGSLPQVWMTSNAASFKFVATRSAIASPVFTHPFYAGILSKTHAFDFNVATSCNVMLESRRISQVTYDYGANDPGFLGRVIGTTLAFQPIGDFLPQDGGLAALPVLAPLTTYAFSLRFGNAVFQTDAEGAPELMGGHPSTPVLLTFTSNQLTVQTGGGLVEQVAWSPTYNAWNFLTFRNANDDNSAIYIELNGVRLPFATPPINLSTVRAIEVVYDSNDNRHSDIDGIYMVDGGNVAIQVQNPLTAIGLRSLALTVSTYSASSASSDQHNVIVGQNIVVNGVNNIAIGRAFASAGDGSIILGTQIGVVGTTTVSTSLYRCIVMGNDMFSGAVMTNVIAIGRGIFNDVGTVGVTLADLNSFASQNPIIIGTNISASLISYSINVGSTFLRGQDGRVYLGVSGEQVCVGTDATTVAAAPSDATLLVGGSIQNATGANQFVALKSSTAFPDTTVGGWVASIASTSANMVVQPASQYAADTVVGVATSFPSNATVALQASGIASVWVCDYGGGSNLPVGALICASPIPGCAAAQWSTIITSATVGKLLQPCVPTLDSGKRVFSSGATTTAASYVLCQLKLG